MRPPAFFDIGRTAEMETESRQPTDGDVTVPVLQGTGTGNGWVWSGPLAILFRLFDWDDQQRR